MIWHLIEVAVLIAGTGAALLVTFTGFTVAWLGFSSLLSLRSGRGETGARQ